MAVAYRSTADWCGTQMHVRYAASRERRRENGCCWDWNKTRRSRDERHECRSDGLSSGRVDSLDDDGVHGYVWEEDAGEVSYRRWMVRR